MENEALGKLDPSGGGRPKCDSTDAFDGVLEQELTIYANTMIRACASNLFAVPKIVDV